MKYDRAILLIRDPFDAFLAEFHRRYSNSHTGFAPIEKFHEPCVKSMCQNVTLWEDYIKVNLKNWESRCNYYIKNYAPKLVHVLRFENLKSDLEAEIQSLMDFLDLKFDKRLKKCIMEKQKGSFKRPKSDIYTSAQRQIIDQTIQQVYTKLGII